jgi:hypothetical protein
MLYKTELQRAEGEGWRGTLFIATFISRQFVQNPTRHNYTSYFGIQEVIKNE